MATGLTPITVGRGFPTKISAGPRITMVGGLTWGITAGFGFREPTWIGDQPGFRGERVAIILAGPRCRRAVRASFMKDGLSAPESISSTTSGRNITTFVMFASSANPTCEIGYFQQRRMNPISQTQ